MADRPADQVELHLLRHADAGDPLAWDKPDAERPLSRKGKRQAERLAGLLLAARFTPDALLSSPLLRATQTARRIGRTLGLEPVVDERLAGALSLPEVEAILADHGSPRRPILVGHDPAFSRLVATLCATDAAPVAKGALVRIDVQRPLQAGTGTLRWLAPPELLRAPRKR